MAQLIKGFVVKRRPIELCADGDQIHSKEYFDAILQKDGSFHEDRVFVFLTNEKITEAASKADLKKPVKLIIEEGIFLVPDEK